MKYYDKVEIIAPMKGFEGYGIRKGSVGIFLHQDGEACRIFFPNSDRNKDIALTIEAKNLRKIGAKKWERLRMPC